LPTTDQPALRQRRRRLPTRERCIVAEDGYDRPVTEAEIDLVLAVLGDDIRDILEADE
jgi:hypothetical protein